MEGQEVDGPQEVNAKQEIDDIEEMVNVQILDVVHGEPDSGQGFRRATRTKKPLDRFKDFVIGQQHQISVHMDKLLQLHVENTRMTNGLLNKVVK